MNRSSRGKGCGSRPADSLNFVLRGGAEVHGCVHGIRFAFQRRTRCRIEERRAPFNRECLHRRCRSDVSRTVANVLPASARTCRNASCIDCFAIRVSRLSTTAFSARTTSSTSSIVMRNRRRRARTTARSDPALRCLALNSARHRMVRDDISGKDHYFRTDKHLSPLTREKGAA